MHVMSLRAQPCVCRGAVRALAAAVRTRQHRCSPAICTHSIGLRSTVGYTRRPWDGSPHASSAAFSALYGEVSSWSSLTSPSSLPRSDNGRRKSLVQREPSDISDIHDNPPDGSLTSDGKCPRCADAGGVTGAATI